MAEMYGILARGKPNGAWKNTWQKYLEVWRAASRMAHARTRGRNIWKSGARQAAWRMAEHVAEIYGSLAARQAAWRMEEHVAEMYGSLARGKPHIEEHVADIYGSLRLAASRMAHRRTHGRNIW